MCINLNFIKAALHFLNFDVYSVRRLVAAMVVKKKKKRRKKIHHLNVVIGVRHFFCWQKLRVSFTLPCVVAAFTKREAYH
jgi:hypothetical protein